MSGPKVFHVVTREEIIAICEGHLSRLDAAIAEWNRTCATNGGAGQVDIEAVVARRDALRAMITSERFTELQKQVPAEISFLKADAKQRLERASAAALKARQAARRSARTAQMLLDALDRKGVALPEEVRRQLQTPSPSGSEVDAVMARAFALLAADQAKGVSARQREIAEQLGRGEKRMTLSEWLASQPSPSGDGSLLKIDRYLVELSELGIDPSPFEARATAIASQPSARQTLLSDSLLFDLARTVKEAREHVGILSGLRERNAELARFASAAAKELRTEIEKALVGEDATAARSLIERANAFIAEEIRGMAAVARRRAVLRGLASLGYEVTEGMATAWVEGGRVVLRKSANPEYGVELAGGTKSERFQVRAVGFGSAGASRDASRDRDMETIWCDEFARLQALLAGQGGKIEIEDALPVGAVPMKVIEQARGEDRPEVRVPLQQRVLR
jgi:hypothetical protein